MDDSNELAIEIFSGTLWECQLVVSMLHDIEIESYLINSVFSTYAFMPTRAEQTRVMISSHDKIKAQKIIDEYNSNLQNDSH